MYAYLIASIALFSAGYATSHQLDKAELIAIKSAIATSNAEAEMTLKIAQNKINEANKQSEIFNQQLDKANAQNLTTINVLHGNIARLRASSGQNSSNTVSDSINTEQFKREAESTEFSGRISELLYRADVTANYAMTAWQFINQNCGIK